MRERGSCAKVGWKVPVSFAPARRSKAGSWAAASTAWSPAGRLEGSSEPAADPPKPPSPDQEGTRLMRGTASLNQGTQPRELARLSCRVLVPILA